MYMPPVSAASVGMLRSPDIISKKGLAQAQHRGRTRSAACSANIYQHHLNVIYSCIPKEGCGRLGSFDNQAIYLSPAPVLPQYNSDYTSQCHRGAISISEDVWGTENGALASDNTLCLNLHPSVTLRRGGRRRGEERQFIANQFITALNHNSKCSNRNGDGK